jgi:LysR family transcriptional regulator, low CO2-responsive transcriptional regulator
MIDSEWLRSFVMFGETLSFTHAAKRLHISQPALHVQIRKLSESLATPLYERHGRALSLTAQGRKLLAYGREQQERENLLLDELKPGGAEGSVVLAAGEGTFLNLLSPALRAFQRTKQAKLRVLTRDRDQALAAVQLGEAHLAVTVVDEVPPSLVARRVARIGAAVVMPKAHRLAKKRTLSIRDLQGEPLIAPSPGRPLRESLARAWADAELTWSPAVEANGWELMMRFAELGMGMAIVNDFCQPPRGTVRRRLTGFGSVQYQLLRLRDRKPTPAALVLEQLIVDGASLRAD